MQRLGLQVLNGGGVLIAGSTAFITVMLTDMSPVYTTNVPIGTPNPIGPPATVTITLTTPSGQTKVSQASMTPDGSKTGLFDYTYTSSTLDERGLWYASFNGADGTGDVAVFPQRPIFQVESI